LPICRREIFNRWYSTSAYFFALTIIDIPIIVLTTLTYVSITYFLTNQPMEIYRFGLYYITILITCFAAQSLGLISGSLMNVKFTLILGSFFICPFVLFSNFFVQLKDTAAVFHWIFELSFIKHALTGSLIAIFGLERLKMDCQAEICYYRSPQKFMESLGISDTFLSVVIKLTAFVVVFRAIAFVIMWKRLKH
jgi:ATP-binding cassette, subfamily G (WHITE), member 1